MHPATKLQFERAVREFVAWKAVPDDDRSPAPAWWWQPAFEVANDEGEMISLWCHRLELPPGSTYATGAAVLMKQLQNQKAVTNPQEFPKASRRAQMTGSDES
jgi:hypothetical protein